MQCGEEGDVRMLAERIAQRQRAVGGEFGQQPVGKRLEPFIFLGSAALGLGRYGIVVRVDAGRAVRSLLS